MNILLCTSSNSPYAVLRDAKSGKWLCLSSPRRLFAASRLEEVLPLLRQIEAEVERTGLYAAGFVSYDAAPAFDPALSAKRDADFPLLWFGLFQDKSEVERLPSGERTSALPSSWEQSITAEEYRDSLSSVRKYIEDGDTYQVNFTYRLWAKTGAEPWSHFLWLMSGHEMPYSAYFDTGAWAVLSASPELFFRLDGEEIESRPMKGTAARGLWPADDREREAKLVLSEKNRAENLMIVDMVRNDLGRIARTGSIAVPSLFAVEKYPTVFQMTSSVCAKTAAPLEQVFTALFPPASVTGAPKCRTMEIISELETCPRRLYTGAIGFIGPGRHAQFNVAIRTLIFKRESGSMEYGVGGGIVWDSHCAMEAEECRQKAQILFSARPEFELLETILWLPEGGYQFLSYHLKRICESAEYFGFCLDVAHIQNELERVAQGLAQMPHRVRLVIARDGTPCCEPAVLDQASAGFGKVCLARAPVSNRDVFLYHKTTNREVYESALRSCPGADDVLLYNEAGEVTESTIANVAVELEGVLFTPPVCCGLLNGTCRERLLQQGRLRQRVIRVDEVLSIGEVYLMNSVRGIHRIRIEC